MGISVLEEEPNRVPLFLSNGRATEGFIVSFLFLARLQQ